MGRLGAAWGCLGLSRAAWGCLGLLVEEMVQGDTVCDTASQESLPFHSMLFPHGFLEHTTGVSRAVGGMIAVRVEVSQSGGGRIGSAALRGAAGM